MVILSLAVLFHFSSLFHRTDNPPVPTCGISVVSYRFEGAPGSKFIYRGATYVVPRSGWVEFLANPHATAETLRGRNLPLGGSPLDEFGTRHIPLASPR